MQQMNPVDSRLLIESYVLDVFLEQIKDDPYEPLSGEMVIKSPGDKASIPDNAGLIELKAGIIKGSRKFQIALLKEYTKEPGEGADAIAPGSEEQDKTKDFIMEFNDCFHVTTDQQYGISKITKAPYGFDKTNQAREARYWSQVIGRYQRQMICEGVSSNLTQGPVFARPSIHPNWFFPHTDVGNQPRYRVSQSDFIDHVVWAANAAGNKATGMGSLSSFSLDYIQQACQYARTTLKMLPYNINGKQKYICFLPSPQVTWAMNPYNECGKIFVGMTRVEQGTKIIYPNMLFETEECVFFADDRYPTLTVGGTGSAGSHSGNGTVGPSFGSEGGAHGSLTFRYCGIGNDDEGASDQRDFSDASWQIGMLYGQGFGMKWVAEAPHWEWNFANYDKDVGQGIFQSIGFKRLDWNSSANTNLSMQNQGSMILPLSVPPTMRSYPV